MDDFERAATTVATQAPWKIRDPYIVSNVPDPDNRETRIIIVGDKANPTGPKPRWQITKGDNGYMSIPLGT